MSRTNEGGGFFPLLLCFSLLRLFPPLFSPSLPHFSCNVNFVTFFLSLDWILSIRRAQVGYGTFKLVSWGVDVFPMGVYLITYMYM